MTATVQPGASVADLKNFVNGEYVTAAADRTSEVVDPSTGEAYALAPVSGPQDVDAALRSELRDTSLDQWFKDRHAAWNVVGRVCFHLAENKADEERPFAFLATYTTRLSSRTAMRGGRCSREPRSLIPSPTTRTSCTRRRRSDAAYWRQSASPWRHCRSER